MIDEAVLDEVVKLRETLRALRSAKGRLESQLFDAKRLAEHLEQQIANTDQQIVAIIEQIAKSASGIAANEK